LSSSYSHAHLSPLARYRQDLLRQDFYEDLAQKAAVVALDTLYQQLIELDQAKPATDFFDFLKPARFFRQTKVVSIKGLYLWGGVGRGKTYLMDCFYEGLPLERKMRVHFHRFMRLVHAELKQRAGHKDPLIEIAKSIAGKTQIICFDEFFVADITDAMILATLLETLFTEGVVLVATSNCYPDDLYKNGLQRARFLPAIEMIKAHTQVLNVDAGTDYRLRALSQAELYHSPLDAAADESLMKSFRGLIANAEVEENIELEIEGRKIAARFRAQDVVWFDFMALCDGPRSQNDYIELACEYHSVILSNIPQLHREQDDQVRRFVNLIDEFYDRRVKLVISAAQPLDKLYAGGKLDFEFQRTVSRLLEMQSHEYLAQPHRP
jgi:cell division protein ZapE